MIIVSMHLLPRMNDMLDFIFMGQADLQEYILAHSWTRTHNLDLYLDAIPTELTGALIKAVLSY